MDDWIAEEGYPGRGGVTYVRHLDAYNFALYSKHATGVTLHFYRPDDIAGDVIGEPISTDEYRLGPRSVVVLVRERP